MAKVRKFDKFKFLVLIDGFTRAGFQKASGLKETAEITEYREGGSLYPDKDPGLINVDVLTLERGVTDNEDLYNWWKSIREGNDDRRNLAIIQQDRKGNELKRWNVPNCFPSSFQYADMDSTVSEKNIEIMEIAIDEPVEVA